ISSSVWCAVLWVAAAVAETPAPTALELFEREIQSVFQSAQPAVVKVHAYRRAAPLDPLMRPLHKVGSGFFLRADGVVVTAAIVVGDADTCWLEWNDQQLPAQIVGQCPRVNVAVLRTPARNGGFPAPKIASHAELPVGSLVMAVGFPYDKPVAPSAGFVLGRDIQCGPRLFPTSHWRTSCKLSPGQTGGPLLNARGEVVGLVVAAHMDDQSYALPIAAVQKVADDLLEIGQPRHPWVGLDVTEREVPLTLHAGKQYEVSVREVIPNTPAARGGFRERDRIQRIGTNEVRRLCDVLDTIFLHRPGDEVVFSILRDGTEHTLRLTVGTRPAPSAPSTIAAPPVLPEWKPVGQD
ncbi:MAG: S1C family serine protease, partial [Verrucomicrobiae bacterium]|nr:S1C family serine protease [Verrucomicrobiae bacterium]